MDAMTLAQKVESLTREEDLRTITKALQEQLRWERQRWGQIPALARQVEASAELLKNSNEDSVLFEQGLKAHKELVRQLRIRAEENAKHFSNLKFNSNQE